MREIKLIPNKSKRTGFVPIMLIDVKWNEKVKSYVANIMNITGPFTPLVRIEETIVPD